MARPNSKNMGVKSKEKATEGPSRKRIRSGPGSRRPAAQPNPNEKPKRIRHKWGQKWVKDYGRAWYASFKPHPGECNIHLVQEACTKLRYVEAPDEICVCGVVVLFTDDAIYDFLGTDVGRRFFFCSILTRYLRHHGVFEEEAGYRLPVLTLWEDVTQSRHLDDVHEAFAELVDNDMPTPEAEPHVEPASDEEAEATAQDFESDSDDGDSDHAPTGCVGEEQDDND
ncbi:hypothetical protein RND71_039701 [Anisodus tanguticus]|uniref:Uncharacterized protein n=1 Tax=Anisodus tanguticus TaxID=243964 RepID=A0AAE1UY08_9SOLA|nr:hypothetical protein RND71_039701 [Anisodus tanguticus]